MTDDVLETILRDVLDVIPDGVFVTNTDREIIYWNEAAARIAGYAAEDVIGARCCDLLADRDADRASRSATSDCFLVRAMETGAPQIAGDVYLLRGDGRASRRGRPDTTSAGRRRARTASRSSAKRRRSAVATSPPRSSSSPTPRSPTRSPACSTATTSTRCSSSSSRSSAASACTSR